MTGMMIHHNLSRIFIFEWLSKIKVPNSRLTGGPAVFHVDLFADGGAPVNSFVRPGCTDCGILVLIGKGSSEASSRFRSMRLATVRLRALAVSINNA